MRGNDPQAFAAVGAVGEAAWYVVEALHRKERLALRNLARRRLACFDPRFRQTRRHARRTDKVLAPLFLSGPFAGQLARVEQLHSGDRVRLAMGLPGESVPVTADLASRAPVRGH